MAISGIPWIPSPLGSLNFQIKEGVSDCSSSLLCPNETKLDSDPLHYI